MPVPRMTAAVGPRGHARRGGHALPLLIVAIVGVALGLLGSAAPAPAAAGGQSLWTAGAPAYQPRAHLACHCPDVYGPSGRLSLPPPGLR